MLCHTIPEDGGIVLSPDERNSPLVEAPHTDALEHIPRMFDHRSALAERRQQILQQKAGERRTDAIPALKLEPGMKSVGHQLLQLREENKHLRVELSALSRDFQERVEEEAHKMVTEAAKILESDPDQAPVLLHDVVKSLQLRAQQLEDKHLVETLYLKRGVQQFADMLQQERQQIEQERQQLIKMRYSIREQAELRRKTLQAHLYARWRASFVLATVALLAVLVVLQFVLLSLFGSMSIAVAFALIVPILVCGVLALLLSHPISMIRHIYQSVPYKKRVNA
jgi:multidrug efflux pump subunit AcrB